MSFSTNIETYSFQSDFYLPLSIVKAQDLSASFERLLARHQTVSSLSAYGLHNRKRSGLGERFWQYRAYETGEDASKIDWRRSARGDQLYVKEKELESLRDYNIWIDCASSMKFLSTLGQEDKLTRAIIIGLAIADLILRSGDRVGLLGSSAPPSSHVALKKIAHQLEEHIVSNFNSSIPLLARPSKRSKIIIISDFLNNSANLKDTLNYYSNFEISGLIIMINDPCEVAFPFSGETQFFNTENNQHYYAGEAQHIAKQYHRVFEKHKLHTQKIAIENRFQYYHHITNQSLDEASSDIVELLSLCLADI
jgi:uncharacterized protein (DUF58 family)